jgi:hypothetical protein
MSCTLPEPGNVLLINEARWDEIPRSGTWTAGVPLVCPEIRDGYPWATVGTAFDFQLRFLLGERDFASLIATPGAVKLAHYWGLRGPVPRAFKELSKRMEELAASGPDWGRPTAPAARRDLAQLSYALALYEQCFRAPIDDGWPLLQLGKRATLKTLLASLRDDALQDLTGLIQLFVETQPELLESDSRVFNPTFAASGMLGGADADLVLDHRLLDVKTKLSGDIARIDFWQLLGYALADFDDVYGIQEVGFYFSRQGIQVAWSLPTLAELLSGSPQDIAVLRQRFRETVEPLLGDVIAARLAALEAGHSRRPGGTRFTVTFGGPGLSSRDLAGNALPTSKRPGGRDCDSEAILRKLSFRPQLSGKGRWHVALADNRYLKHPPAVADPGATPSCNARVVLNAAAAPITVKRGTRRGDYPDTLCASCLDMTGRFFYDPTEYPEPTVGPPERWRFREPAKRGQRWHIIRRDFYVGEDSDGGICNAFGELKPGGETVLASEADDSDPRYCRHCLRMMALGGHASRVSH